MALGNHKGTPSTWLELNAKTGELTAWDKEARKEVGYDYVAGMVTGIDVSSKTWPDGTTSWQVNTRMKDPETGDKYVVQMGATSRMALRLLGQLNNADLSRPIYIAPYQLKEGEQLNNGETAKMDSTLTSVKYVNGVAADGRLELSDGIKPSYGPQHGDTMPKSEPVMHNGKQVIQNGRPLYDNGWRDQFGADLVAAVSARIHGAPAQGQGEDEGVNPAEAMRERRA
jgi:hypothetical protein